MPMKSGNKYLLWIILAALAVLIGVGGAALWSWYSGGGLQKAVLEQFSSRVVQNQSQMNLLEEVLGNTAPQTYLVLFLNNTELRPAGGFIGAYAVVKIDKSKPQIIKVEGTEILDNLAPKDFPAVPPEPLKKYLFIDRWNLRDSNWSPDWPTAAAKALELYKQEHGVSADEVSGVIGFTPTIFEELLKITGPLKVGTEEFNAQNFTEKLEYEVEYGYAQHGLDFDARKQILVELSQVVMKKMIQNIWTYWPQYLNLAQHMLDEKQIAAYSTKPEVEQVVLAQGWGGEMKNYPGDYLLWVDANLASLKTDLVIDRSLTYTISPAPGGKYLAKATMHYVHSGQFDWRTSRYRDYARIFVPVGSRLVKTTGAMKTDRSTEPGTVDQGVENGRQWFGTFISIEPGKTGDLSFEFELSPEVVKLLQSGTYTLYAQKQIGTLQPKLTLNLDFGRDIVSAVPTEKPENFGDKKYTLETDLLVDRSINIQLK